MAKKSIVPVTDAVLQQREADAAAHADPLGRRRPDAVAELAEVGHEDEVPRLPGAAGEADALPEGRGQGDLAELLAGVARLLHERQGPVSAGSTRQYEP